MSQNLVTPTDGMIVTQDTRFAPGVYPLSQGITIGADSITVEGDGVLIVDQSRTGVGVTLDGRRDVTLRGLSISGYHNGIRADHCRNVTIENVRVRETAEVDGITTFLYLWTPIEGAYGGAILFYDVQGGAVRGCDLQHQMNGIMLYACSGLTVERNNASFNSGWGVYLSASSENVVQDNQLDFCNRVFRRPDGTVRVEADSAGIVLVYSSSRNQFLRNSCLCGGDGIFVAGYDHKGHQGPCNDNLFEDNDCRLSPNNAIESTFSRGNVFRRNDCSRSNFGMWMGYSWDNVIEDNIIEFSRWAGIAIEHGFNFTIRNNRIRLNNEGIRLWTRGGGVLPYWPGHEVCYAFAIEGNLFESNRTAFHGYTGEEAVGVLCHDVTLRGNTIRDNRIGVRFADVHGCAVEGNTFDANLDVAVLLEDDPGVTVGENTYAGNAEDVRRAPRTHDFQKNL